MTKGSQYLWGTPSNMISDNDNLTNRWRRWLWCVVQMCVEVAHCAEVSSFFTLAREWGWCRRQQWSPWKWGRRRRRWVPRVGGGYVHRKLGILAREKGRMRGRSWGKMALCIANWRDRGGQGRRLRGPVSCLGHRISDPNLGQKGETRS
jgi:hypothetical protein